MNKRIQKTLLGLMVVVPVLAIVLAPVSFAQSFRASDTITVAKMDVVNSALYAGGKTITIEGTVNGDVFCAGSSITISGTVNGDVICAGQTVTVSGTVNGDVRLAGETISLEGHVLRNASIAGSMLTITSTGAVDGDAQVGTGTFTMNGTVGRDLTIGSETTTINGTVARDISAETATLGILSNGKIGGNITYHSENELSTAAGSRITGKINWDKYVATQRSHRYGMMATAGIAGLVGFSLLVFAMILVLIAPQRFRKASDLARANWSKTMAIGLLATIVVPFVMIFSFISVIGAPVGFLLSMAFASALLLSGPFAAQLLGRVLLGKRTKNVIWQMLLGAVVILALYIVPIINILTALLVMWFGVGMLVQSIGYAKPKYN